MSGETYWRLQSQVQLLQLKMDKWEPSQTFLTNGILNMLHFKIEAIFILLADQECEKSKLLSNQHDKII